MNDFLNFKQCPAVILCKLVWNLSPCWMSIHQVFLMLLKFYPGVGRKLMKVVSTGAVDWLGEQAKTWVHV